MLPVSTWLLLTTIYGLDAREFKALCCMALVPRHGMKQGVVHCTCRLTEVRQSSVLMKLRPPFKSDRTWRAQWS